MFDLNLQSLVERLILLKPKFLNTKSAVILLEKNKCALLILNKIDSYTLAGLQII